MADETATFAVELQTQQLSDAAKSGENALAELQERINADIGALREMQKAMRNLKGGTSVNVAAFRELRDKITAQKASIAAAQAQYVELGGAFKKVDAKPTIQGLKGLVDAARGSPGPLSTMVGRLSSLKSIFSGGALTLGIIGVTAALVALVVASVAATASLLRYGLAQADAARSERLRLEGLTKLKYSWGAMVFGQRLAADSASFLQEQIDRVSAKVAIGREKVAGYADSLYRAGLRGGNLQEALEGLSIVAATQGDAEAAAFRGWAMSAALTGKSIKSLTDDVRARLGGIAQRQMLSLTVQSAKLKESFAQLFSGLRIEGFLSALHSVTELFSQSTASGRALKVILETLLDPLIGAAEGGATVFKRFFQGLVLGALELSIAFARLRLWLRDTFGQVEIFKNIDVLNVALGAGMAVAFGLAVALGASALALAALVAPLVAVGAAFAGLFYAGLKLGQWLASVDWSGLGRALVDGLVNGLKSGVSAVVDAVKGLANAATSAFKQALGIASPSTVTFGIGGNTGEGLRLGIDKETPRVQAAARRMVEFPKIEAPPILEAVRGARAGLEAPSILEAVTGQQEAPSVVSIPRAETGEPDIAPSPRAAPPLASQAAARAPAPVSFTFGDIHIHGGKTDEPEDYARRLKAEVERLFEGVAIHMGARV